MIILLLNHMGNIDCRNLGKITQGAEIELSDKVCVRIGAVGIQIKDVKGDH